MGILALHGWQRKGKTTVMFASKPSRCLENLRGEEVASHLLDSEDFSLVQQMGSENCQTFSRSAKPGEILSSKGVETTQDFIGSAP